MNIVYKEDIKVDKAGFYRISHNLKGYPIVSIRDKNGKVYLETTEGNNPWSIPINFIDENTLDLCFRVGGFSGTVYCYIIKSKRRNKDDKRKEQRLPR